MPQRYSAGATLVQLAHWAQCSPSTVYRYLVAAGVPMRSRGGRSRARSRACPSS
jgi:hypothetical protein